MVCARYLSERAEMDCLSNPIHFPNCYSGSLLLPVQMRRINASHPATSGALQVVRL